MSVPSTVIQGSGTPEGVITADVGTIFVRTDGTTTTGFVYRKVSGSGNTGWRSLDNQAIRTGGWLTSSMVAENHPRAYINSASIGALTSGTMRMVGRLVVPGGQAVSSVTMMPGTTAGTNLMHTFVVGYDRATLALLFTSVDDTTTPWVAQTERTWQLATTLRGSTPGGTWTPTDYQEVYIGLVVITSGGAMPTLSGMSSTGTAVGFAPKLHGDSTASITALADIPDPAAALGSGITGLPYVGIS